MQITRQTPLKIRDMSGEGEPADGYVRSYEVIINPGKDDETSFGTFDRAPAGERHKLQSWCGEYVGFRGGRGTPWMWMRTEMANSGLV